MNDGFLDADGVIERLVRSGFVEPAEWKHNTRERYYDATFLLSGSRASVISLEIIVEGGVHKIARSAIRLLERRFKKDFSDILTDCAI
jgi:hypothetical protein